MQRMSKLEVIIRSIPLEFRESYEIVGGKHCMHQKIWKTPGEHGPLNHCILCFLPWYFCRSPSSPAVVSLTLAYTWNSFLPVQLPCPDFILGLLTCLIASCFVSFGCHLLEVCSFLKRRLMQVDFEGNRRVEEAGKYEKRENSFNVCYLLFRQDVNTVSPSQACSYIKMSESRT